MNNNYLTNIYYHIKPFIPKRLLIFLRRKHIIRKRLLCRDIWPIDKKAGKPPGEWSGWPGDKRFALVLTHDIESGSGHEKCRDLVKIEQELGFRSSFNFIPERYDVSSELRHYLTGNGFEVGVHDLNHDGKLYKSEKIFRERAVRINRYLKEWDSAGFRSGSMHRNLDWIHELNIEYDASTFDTDPFEPCAEGIGTIFPFIVTNNSAGKYVELPYTLPQDFTLFVLMKEENIDIWKHKLDWIAEHGGMALLTTHPDYMNFNGREMDIDEYPVEYYIELLGYIKSRYNEQYWHVLPGEMSRFWSKNMAKDKTSEDRG